MFELVIVTVVTLGALGYLMARRRVVAMAAASGVHSHSLPTYHGTFVALWAGLPALLLSLVWLLLQDSVIDSLILASLPERMTEGLDAARRSLVISEIRSRSEEHTSELQSLMRISYAVFCLKKKQKELIADY